MAINSLTTAKEHTGGQIKDRTAMVEAEDRPECLRTRTLTLFRKAIQAEKMAGDPWVRHNLHLLPAERARRHRYDMTTDRWVVDETIVKVEREPFDRGAMRRCYRLKKVSQQPNRSHVHTLNWRRANNYVGKQYESAESDSSRILADVRMQRMASSLADRFNKELDPPKSVIIIDCFAIELYERKPPEWMLAERFISGRDSNGRGFVKHNSNVGCCASSDDKYRRLTPQVFSAATFWLTDGASMVTDIQGIADLYTDPQILTADGSFGPGDLGRQGMAHFFQSFDASDNGLFAELGVPIFELTPSQLARCRGTGDMPSSAGKTQVTRSRRERRQIRVNCAPRDADTIYALERVLEAADVAARAAVRRAISREAPPVQTKIKLAVAEVHLALAALETEQAFGGDQIDAGTAVFHCASAAINGSAVAAHALARWHCDLPAAAIVPRYSELKYAYPAAAGPLLVLAAERGDSAAAAAAAYGFASPCWGLPHRPDLAARYLVVACTCASERAPACAVGDLIYVDFAATGFTYEAVILRVRGDGCLDVRYVEESADDYAIPWSRIHLVEPSGYALPCAGADLPPRHKLLADLADIIFSSKLAHIPADFLVSNSIVPAPTAHESIHSYTSRLLLEAAEAARRLRAPELADQYLARAMKLSLLDD